MAVTVAPRFVLGTVPTPLVRIESLERALGCPPLYVKRDDLIGFALAGTKTRLLEQLIADAVAQHCSVILTGGGSASSYCAGAAVAATAAGLRCVLVIYGNDAQPTHPNLALARAAGADVRFTGTASRESVDTTLIRVEEELREAGERPYPVPRGGATAIAALGSARAAAELDAQLSATGIDAGIVLVATGSGTTQAGLVAGAVAAGCSWRVVGASVSRPVADAEAQVRRLAVECAALLGTASAGTSHIDVRDARGPGYGIPSDAGERAAMVALHAAGLLLDPVFTAKAFAMLPALLAESGRRPIIFWHTGGIPVALAHLMSSESLV